jgi:predicted  nucleic acid-binding Zn-ribbon protein
MNARPTFSLQPLEARRFLSATAAALVDDCPEVVEARQDLQSAIGELRHDRYQGRQDLGAIRSQIVEELRKLYESDKGDDVRAAVAPLYKELREALRAQGEARHEVLEDLQAVREKWQPTLVADIDAVWKAKRAGDEDALADATAKIEADRKALYDELNPLKDKLKQVTDETSQAIQDAHDAIEDKIAEFSDTLKDLFARLRTKANDVRDTLVADHQAYETAQQSLADAIKECREEHGGDPTATA